VRAAQLREGGNGQLWHGGGQYLRQQRAEHEDGEHTLVAQQMRENPAYGPRPIEPILVGDGELAVGHAHTSYMNTFALAAHSCAPSPSSALGHAARRKRAGPEAVLGSRHGGSPDGNGFSSTRPSVYQARTLFQALETGPWDSAPQRDPSRRQQLRLDVLQHCTQPDAGMAGRYLRHLFPRPPPHNSPPLPTPPAPPPPHPS